MPSYSRQIVDIDQVALYRQDVEDSLRLFYSSAATNPRFLGYSLAQVKTELDERITELELSSMLILLSGVEAAFRDDYRLRCYKGPIDKLSQAFRKLKKRKLDKVRFEADILAAWKAETNVDAQLISALKGAFKLRHWIAHGRYWDSKVGRKYDFFSIQTLAIDVLAKFPLFEP